MLLLLLLLLLFVATAVGVLMTEAVLQLSQQLKLLPTSAFTALTQRQYHGNNKSVSTREATRPHGNAPLSAIVVA